MKPPRRASPLPAVNERLISRLTLHYLGECD
jgi:hypothetical protein